jgi:hypothetical protein
LQNNPTNQNKKEMKKNTLFHSPFKNEDYEDIFEIKEIKDVNWNFSKDDVNLKHKIGFYD